MSSQSLTISGLRLNIPSPEHGTSNNILSKYSLKWSERRPGVSAVTMVLKAPATCRFFTSAAVLETLISLAISSPLPLSFDAIATDLPPGAAHKSSTLSPLPIGSMEAGSIALGSCI